jgi:hypothetical protein
VIRVPSGCFEVRQHGRVGVSDGRRGTPEASPGKSAPGAHVGVQQPGIRDLVGQGLVQVQAVVKLEHGRSHVAGGNQRRRQVVQDGGQALAHSHVTSP